MQHSRLVLGIESSCDDTSVALVRDDELIDCIVVSSAKEHIKYGGVVPEIAARAHEKVLISLVKEIMDRTGIYWREITHIAYTKKPGLVGCLLVGEVFAKTLSLTQKKPLISVNHIYGHIFSTGLTEEIEFPCLALVVSGKTTAIYYVKNTNDIELLDETADNALGEVYDKAARELGFDYPGGKEIDRLFRKDLDVVKLLSHNTNPSKRFSYSGILSAFIRLNKIVDTWGLDNKQEYMATVFQKWVIDSLMHKLKYWIVKKGAKHLTVSGGVSANKYLRESVEKLNIKSSIVDLRFSGDNAAMIAYYASIKLKEGHLNDVVRIYETQTSD